MSGGFYFEELKDHIEGTKRFVEYANCSVPLKLERKMERSQQEMYMMKCLQKLSGMELLRYSRCLINRHRPKFFKLQNCILS